MTAVPMNGAHAPAHPPIEDVIAHHGAMRVLISAAGALFRLRRPHRARPPDVAQLDARMRRDIGLLPEIDAPDWRVTY